MMCITLSALLLALPACAVQEKPPYVDVNEVDKSVRKGVTFLKSGKGNPFEAHRQGQKPPAKNADKLHTTELKLLTYLHAGVPRDDAAFKTLLKKMLSDKLKYTYRVSLQAMVLEDLDPAKYRARILACAQFLVDNQGANGQWGYGEPVPPPKGIATPGAASGSGGGELPKIHVKKRRNGKPNDNSNSQYAALGLRACHDAGIVIPEAVARKAIDWWHKSQHDFDPGTGVYGGRGWGYKGADSGDPRGTMTAGAVGALAIFHYILGEEWDRDPSLRQGISWLTRTFTLKENPGVGSRHHYYFLYGLERAGRLCNIETFGRHHWYAQGATYLLKQQKGNGSWLNSVVDTCFAILFLQRATRSLKVPAGKKH